VRFLHRTAGQHREAAGADGHDVGVIAENGEGLRRDGTGGDVEDVDVNSPAILNMLGSISSRPCDAVKVVVRAPDWSAPCVVPAAPASDCICCTTGMLPQMFVIPAVAHSSASSAMVEEGVIG
jgi:hypothetical protein